MTDPMALIQYGELQTDNVVIVLFGVSKVNLPGKENG
jgi:hypothetical protein